MILLSFAGILCFGTICFGLGAFTVLAVQKKRRKTKQG